MKIDLQKLYQLQDEGWLMSQTHPTLPLIIWNYTNKTQWEERWCEFTLMCRALVTDRHGNIVAHPLKKFFNYGELVAKGKVPNEDFFSVYKKMDGSLIQLFYYRGNWVVSSRGSFTSDHVHYADKILADKNTPLWDLDRNCNYIFELIHPDTRIVVDYGDRKDLVLLAIIEKDGSERNINECIDIFTLVEEVMCSTESDFLLYLSQDWDSLKNFIRPDEEGYVIKFESGVRMKIKGDEYLRLHKIITMTSSYDIWETLKDNKDITELIERAPDEWLTWVYKTIGEIYVEYRKIYQQIERDWDYGRLGPLTLYYEESPNQWVSSYRRKEIAEYFHTCQYPKLMFSKLDGVEYDSKIWDLVKPKHSKAFSI